MAHTLQPEDQISHYRVVGPLGTGGMGEVYIAKDEKLERSVALKVLPPELVRNEERVRRFVTEARSASSLNHPNIVTIYEIGHDSVQAGDGASSAPVHFISMELVNGETLSQKIHGEKCDVKSLLGWLAQAAEGVSKAHAAGIVHRDLKPGNIMVSQDGFAKVLDFGLAKLTEKQETASSPELTSAPTEMSGRTGAGTIMGTVGYMSPEQVQGKSVDHRSDVFSMGCILYEAATRRRPFHADTDVEVMHQILREKPAPIEELSPGVPAELRRLIRRCLAKSPEQRLQSMKDLAIELREIVDDYDSLSASATSATSAASAPSGVLGTVPGRRTGLVAVVGGAVVLGLAGVAFGLYSVLRGGSGSATGTAFQSMKMSVLMSRDDLNESVLSADGRYLAYVTQSDRKTSLSVRQVRTGSDVVILPESDFHIRGVSFSPDGDYLYFLNRDTDLPNYSALYQVASLGGAPRKVVFDVDSAATFAPDGKRACFRRGLIDQAADSLVVVELETGKERELLRIEDPETFDAPPAWSPGGATIAAGVRTTAGGVKSWLVAVDAETGESRRIGEKTWIGSNSVGWMPDGSAVFVSTFEFGAGTAPQIYRVSYPDGEVSRMTNDLEGYTNISLSADGTSIAAIRRSTVNNIWAARPGSGKDAEPLTFAAGSAGSISGLAPLAGGAVAFMAPRESRVYLWRMNADGSDRRQLTTQGLTVFGVDSAEGAGIVFNQVDGEEKVLSHVWRMDPDGSGLRQVTQGDGEQLVDLSQAGNTILFRKWGELRAVWALKLESGEPYKVVDWEVSEVAFLSPDGTQVFLSKLEEIEGKFFPRRFIVPVEGGEPTASFLLSPGAFDIQWEPGGRALTYVDRAKGWNVMRKPLPDGEPEPLTRFGEGQVANHEWHPDGSRLVLRRRVDQKDGVWILKPGDPEPTLVTEFRTGAIPFYGWAPDEPLLYFAYGTSSQDVVLITAFH